MIRGCVCDLSSTVQNTIYVVLFICIEPFLKIENAYFLLLYVVLQVYNIEGTPEVGTVGVHVDDTNRPPKAPKVITGSNNEDSTLTEGTVRYDVRFDAIAPTAANDAASQDVIRLIINVEAQTAFNPGYPLTKRAIYYCSRMISAQHGPIFKKSEYTSVTIVSCSVAAVLSVCAGDSDSEEV